MPEPRTPTSVKDRPATVRLLMILTVLGCLPALVVLVLVRFEEGSLHILGQAITEYDLGRLTAVLQSILTPVYMLVPIAFSFSGRQRGSRFWLSAAAATWALLLPTLLAGWLSGGRGLGPALLAMALLTVFMLAMLLWLECLLLLLRPAPGLLVYGALWACSEYFDHLRLYVLPYLEVKALALVGWVTWLLPQIKSGPSLVDDFLQSRQCDLMGPLPTLLQCPLLLIGLWLLKKRAAAADATE